MVFGAPCVHTGVCDASAAVFLKAGSTLFLVADDEDQHTTKLRVYDAAANAGPTQEFELDNGVLQADEDEPEIDLEGSCWLGNRIFWIGSHSRSKKGKRRESRHRLFATVMQKGRPTIAGSPYSTLVKDVKKQLGLQLDPNAPPKDGGLSIEGLTASASDGEILIGLRSPVFDGKALLISLLNPLDVVEHGAEARFGDPILLDLRGRGIRSIDWWPERSSYLILAGPCGDRSGSCHLLRWSGPLSSHPEWLDALNFSKLRVDGAPEALLVERKSSTVYVLFDEGNRQAGDVPCKEAEEKSFRSVAISGL